MLPALIHLCILAIILCAAAEPFRRSTHASLQRFSRDLATAKRPPSNSLWRRGQKPPMMPHSFPGPNTAGQDIKLLDIVLAASIDGHFHALNRTTGELIWSMADDLEYLQSPRDPNTESAPAITAQSPLYNLVRSDHRSLVDEEEDDEETYIVEPQTGEVYVMQPLAPADAPVERLGYSLPQLVELSPFKPPGGDERIFVGQKTTSLISLDLLTGRILGVYGERCAWDDNESSEEDPVDVNAMLDDLDGTNELPKKQRPVEVVVGRTDYHVSVHVKGRGIVQTLSFTKYGPNNVHRTIQAAWTRSPDATYFQPSPEGKLYSFANGGLLRYEHTYPLVVAVFDAVYLPTKRDPILLLQPTPKLSDLSSASNADMDVPEVTFIGRIDDSLFAMGHTQYPLVVFSPVGKKQLPRIDDGGKTPTSHSAPNPHSSVERCYDLDCLTGTRWSQDASRSGLSRLIEDAHVLAIEGSAGVEDPPTEPEFDLPQHDIPQSRPRPDRPRGQTPAQPQTIAPSPTRTTNSTSHARPHVGSESETTAPEATPSHRTTMRTIASEWLAAWASMGGVVLSTVMFGLGLGVRKGRVGAGIWKVFNVKNSLESTPEPTPEPESKPTPTPAEDDEDDETPPPVPPKPYSLSLSKMQNPYLLTTDSRPGVPPKDKDLATPRKRARPRVRSGLPTTATVPMLPPGRLEALKSSGSGEEGVAEVVEEPESTVMVVKKTVVEAVEKNGAETVEETEQEESTPGKKRTRRGRRGKGRGKGGSTGDATLMTSAAEDSAAGVMSEASESFVRVEKAVVPKSSLAVSEEVLGYGSHGTVVYKGRFQGRSVAVKRLLHDFVTLASREVALLQESDDHPNVIRYYYEEHRENFLYIALELCPCSLADIVERPQQFPDVVGSFDPKKALSQVTAGLKHLHALKIVHRDIKPQNILVSARGNMLISDFGLCRKLEVDQTSFMPTVGAAAGTAGWRAPEILRGDVKIDMAALDVSNGGIGSGSNGGTTGTGATRLTRSVDVFALGCLFFYVLSGGDHAYGDRFERDVNIMRDEKRLGWLERLGEEGMEAIDLIEKMLSPAPKKRPDTTTCLMHPFFWTPGRRLTFLQDASDRFEIMERDPREPGLVALETGAQEIVGTDWQRRLDKMFIDNLGKFRKYDVKSVQDLLRALRNKKNHYQDLPDNVKRHLGPLPEGFLSYFTRRFPKLFLHVYSVVADSPLRVEPMFRSYFALEE